MDRRACALPARRAGPRTTLLPPDIYTSHCLGTRYGCKMLKLRARILAARARARDAAFRRVEGRYYLLIPSKERTIFSHGDRLSPQLKAKRGKSSGQPPFHSELPRIFLYSVQSFESYIRFTRMYVNYRRNNPAGKLACHRKLWLSVDKVRMQTKRRRMR